MMADTPIRRGSRSRDARRQDTNCMDPDVDHTTQRLRATSNRQGTLETARTQKVQNVNKVSSEVVKLIDFRQNPKKF
jgi:hypothetical protein